MYLEGVGTKVASAVNGAVGELEEEGDLEEPDEEEHLRKGGHVGNASGFSQAGGGLACARFHRADGLVRKIQEVRCFTCKVKYSQVERYELFGLGKLGENLPHRARLDGRLVEAPHLLALVPLVHEREGVQVLDDRASGSEHADCGDKAFLCQLRRRRD